MANFYLMTFFSVVTALFPLINITSLVIMYINKFFFHVLTEIPIIPHVETTEQQNVTNNKSFELTFLF